MICEVDPADVVSVPHDCGYQKVRCAKYRVLCDFQGPLNDFLATSAAPYQPYDQVEDEDEEDNDRIQFACTESIDECPECGEYNPDSFHYVKRADITLCTGCGAELCIDSLGYAIVAPKADES